MEKFKGVMNMKRKELEEVNDDFSDFSLTSPARKIRRLDYELPPIIEEEEADLPMGYQQPMPNNMGISDGVREGIQLKPPVIEELPYVPENEERAIVLFKPVNSSLSCSQGSFSVDPSLISSFKNQALWGNISAAGNSEKDEHVADGEDGDINSCRAVIPWAPSQKLNLRPEAFASEAEVSEAMDAEEPEATSMEIEDAGAPYVEQQSTVNSNLSRFNEGLPHQWQQQHCMIPQPPENTATPIVWYR